jgi:hypothetical protein
LRDHLLCVTGIVVEEAQEHEDLERFGQPEHNTICPLLVYYYVYALA